MKTITIYHFDPSDPEYVFNQLSSKKAPVDLEEVCQKLEIDIDRSMPIEMLGYSGAISRVNGKTTIWVNPADSVHRQRFTLAHEIGHYVRHFTGSNGDIEMKDDLTKFRRAGLWDSEEYEANQYAASLLMPRLLVYSELEKCIKSDLKGTNNIIARLAKAFQVSKDAMKYRLINLDLLEDESQKS